jgi:hypothetical protein
MINLQGKVYTGDSNQLFAYGIGSDLEIQGAKQIQELTIKGALETKNEAKKSYAQQIMKIAADNETGDGKARAFAIEQINRLGFALDNQGQVIALPAQGQAAPRAEAAPGQVQPRADGTITAEETVVDVPSVRQSQPGDTVAITALRKSYKPTTGRNISNNQRIANEAHNKEVDKAILNLQQKAAEVPIKVEEVEQTEFVKYGDEIRNKGSDGGMVRDNRKRQIEILKTNPQIANIFAGKGTEYDNARRFILDTLSGRFSGSEGGAERATELGKLSLSAPERAAIEEFANLTQSINQKTLRDAAGPGAVSDAEQRANKQANITFIERTDPAMAVNELYRSQFYGDLSAAKADMLNKGQYKTRKEFDTAWSQKQSQYIKQYEGIYAARINLIKPFNDAYEQARKDNDKEKMEKALERRRDAIRYGMELYPPPAYDSSTQTMKFATPNARNAAAKALLEKK